MGLLVFHYIQVLNFSTIILKMYGGATNFLQFSICPLFSKKRPSEDASIQRFHKIKS